MYQPIYQPVRHPVQQPPVNRWRQTAGRVGRVNQAMHAFQPVPINQPISQPISQPINQPVYRQYSAPMPPATHRPVVQRQFSNQPIYEPINQPVMSPVQQYQPVQRPLPRQPSYQPATDVHQFIRNDQPVQYQQPPVQRYQQPQVKIDNPVMCRTFFEPRASYHFKP